MASAGGSVSVPKWVLVVVLFVCGVAVGVAGALALTDRGVVRLASPVDGDSTANDRCPTSDIDHEPTNDHDFGHQLHLDDCAQDGSVDHSLDGTTEDHACASRALILVDAYGGSTTSPDCDQ